MWRNPQVKQKLSGVPRSVSLRTTALDQLGPEPRPARRPPVSILPGQTPLCCFPPARQGGQLSRPGPAEPSCASPYPTRSLCPGTQVLKCPLADKRKWVSPMESQLHELGFGPMPPSSAMGRALMRPVLSTHQINPSEGQSKGAPTGNRGPGGHPFPGDPGCLCTSHWPSPCTTGPLVSIVFAHLPGNPFPGQAMDAPPPPPGQAPDLPSRDHGCTEGSCPGGGPGPPGRKSASPGASFRLRPTDWSRAGPSGPRSRGLRCSRGVSRQEHPARGTQP